MQATFFTESVFPHTVIAIVVVIWGETRVRGPCLFNLTEVDSSGGLSWFWSPESRAQAEIRPGRQPKTYLNFEVDQLESM